MISVCMFIVSKTLLISSATVGAIWLNPFATVLFSVCSAITVFIQGRGCYSTFGWVPSIASLIILLQLLLSNVIKKSE